MAETLRALGSEAAWLVHGSDGTDEISICGPSTVVALKGGQIEKREVHPEMAGLPVHPFRDIIGGAPEENAYRLRALLNGTAGAYRDAAVLNSAAANADHNSGLDASDLFVARVNVDEGPTIRRYRPRAQGRPAARLGPRLKPAPRPSVPGSRSASTSSAVRATVRGVRAGSSAGPGS